MVSEIRTLPKKKTKKTEYKWLGSLVKWAPAILLLILWEFAVGDSASNQFFSQPSLIIQRMIQDLSRGLLQIHALETIKEIMMGYFLGVTIGFFLGYFSGINEKVAGIIQPYAFLLNSIPKVAIAPLVIIWFGIGPSSKIALATLMVFFLVFFNVFLGVRGIKRDYIDLAHIMGAKSREIILHVVLPSITPFIFTGLKQSIVFAMIGALVGEFVAASRGLGYYIQLAAGSLDATGVFVGVFILMGFVMLVIVLIDLLEKSIVRWNPSR